MRRRNGRQQAQLNFARHRDITLKLRLLAANSLVEPRVLNRNRHLCGQRSEHMLVLVIEKAGARMLQISGTINSARVSGFISR